MLLRDFSIWTGHTNNDEYVLINARLGNQTIKPVAKIKVNILAEQFSIPKITGEQANSIVKEYIEALGRIINDKHNRNQVLPNHSYVELSSQEIAPIFNL